jgi:hypothetical protein
VLKSSGRRIYDLAGNGLEWTSKMCNKDPIAKYVGRAHLGEEDTVILRGFTYFADKPLPYTYYQLEYKTETPQECRAIKQGRKDIGFRLVIYPPEKAQ